MTDITYNITNIAYDVSNIRSMIENITRNVKNITYQYLFHEPSHISITYIITLNIFGSTLLPGNLLGI